jgi:hypothetical protein
MHPPTVYDRFPLQTSATLMCPLVWELHKVGHQKYRLSVEWYQHSGVVDGKVVASIDPEYGAEWEITHQEYHNAFT